MWWQEADYLLFSDHRDSRQFKWTQGAGVVLVKDQTSGGNGQTRDRKGREVVCERIGRRLARFEADGELTVMAYEYQGRPLNSPNDVVMKSDGAIYFTDPGAPRPGSALDFAGVYRLSADLGSLTLLVRDFVFPNGLAFSPDERVLYLIDTQRSHIRAFDMQPDGMLARGSDRVFFQFESSERPGLNDGMKVDSEGNVYCTGPGGIWVIDPRGRALGLISAGAKFHTNCAWGGGDWKTLFFTTRESLCRIRLNISGVPVPATPPKRS